MFAPTQRLALASRTAKERKTLENVRIEIKNQMLENIDQKEKWNQYFHWSRWQAFFWLFYSGHRRSRGSANKEEKDVASPCIVSTYPSQNMFGSETRV